MGGGSASPPTSVTQILAPFGPSFVGSGAECIEEPCCYVARFLSARLLCRLATPPSSGPTGDQNFSTPTSELWYRDSFQLPSTRFQMTVATTLNCSRSSPVIST